MVRYKCPECGNMLKGTETSCPQCGCPLRPAVVPPASPSASAPSAGNRYDVADEGDNNAENILRSALRWIRILMIIGAILSGIGVIVWGVGMDTMAGWNGGGTVLGLIGGIVVALLGILFANLVWAMGMIFINISTNVRTIKREVREIKAAQ